MHQSDRLTGIVQDAAEEPRAAARQVAQGYVGALARRWLAGLAITCLALFGLDSVLVLNGLTQRADRAVELFVQQFPWGPLAFLMAATNADAGYWQIATGLLFIVIVAAVDHRGGWLMAIGSLASVLDNLMKDMVERNRPAPDLVHVVKPVTGYSFPSGHAVFFTWLYFMLVFVFAPKLPRAVRPWAWTAALFLALLACLGRVWVGAHWPSDVAGGFLFALGWAALVLWLPERWLPSPSRRWLGPLPRYWRHRPA